MTNYKVLCIGQGCNEPSNTSRWREANFKREGISAESSAPVMAESLGLDTRYNYQIDRPGNNWSIGPKPVGIVLAHFSAWNSCAIDSHAGPYMIFEDDVQLCHEFKNKVEDALRPLPADWDYLFLGSCCTPGKLEGGPGSGVFDVRYPMCAHAYMISKVMAKYLIDSFKRCWAPMDVLLALEVLHGRKVYTSWPNLAWQTGTQL